MRDWLTRSAVVHTYLLHGSLCGCAVAAIAALEAARYQATLSEVFFVLATFGFWGMAYSVIARRENMEAENR
jgi:hypothetical protein